MTPWKAAGRAPGATRRRVRFHGRIIGFGTTSGTRVVIGQWHDSPLGTFADVMVERPDGHRVLLAPSDDVADFVQATYQFDEVLRTAVSVTEVGAGTAMAARTEQSVCRVVAGPLTATVQVGPPTLLGRLLALLPARLAGSVPFATLADPVARVVLRGVRTRGTAGSGRREWYSARGIRALTAAAADWDGQDLGVLADVWPPVRFGFGSTPRRPSVTAVTTTIELSGSSAAYRRR